MATWRPLLNGETGMGDLNDDGDLSIHELVTHPMDYPRASASCFPNAARGWGMGKYFWHGRHWLVNMFVLSSALSSPSELPPKQAMALVYIVLKIVRWVNPTRVPCLQGLCENGIQLFYFRHVIEWPNRIA